MLLRMAARAQGPLLVLLRRGTGSAAPAWAAPAGPTAANCRDPFTTGAALRALHYIKGEDEPPAHPCECGFALAASARDPRACTRRSGAVWWMSSKRGDRHDGTSGHRNHHHKHVHHERTQRRSTAARPHMCAPAHAFSCPADEPAVMQPTYTVRKR